MNAGLKILNFNEFKENKLHIIKRIVKFINYICLYII